MTGITKLATVTTSPYSFLWNRPKIARDTHQLTAVATDVAGSKATSQAITVNITQVVVPAGLAAPGGCQALALPLMIFVLWPAKNGGHPFLPVRYPTLLKTATTYGGCGS